MRTQK